VTVVNNVIDGQAYSVVVDIEAASQLSVAMVESSAAARSATVMRWSLRSATTHGR
jgi:hypothetical protein